MKEIISNLSKTFDSRIRVGIMSILMKSDWVDFTTLRDTLQLTDGNLSSHLRALEKENMLKVKKHFVKNRPRSSYKITRNGLRKFRLHLDTFEKLIQK